MKIITPFASVASCIGGEEEDNWILAPDQGYLCRRKILQRIKDGFNQIYIMWRNFPTQPRWI